jgi:hypothetical protein
MVRRSALPRLTGMTALRAARHAVVVLFMLVEAFAILRTAILRILMAVLVAALVTAHAPGLVSRHPVLIALAVMVCHFPSPPLQSEGIRRKACAANDAALIWFGGCLARSFVARREKVTGSASGCFSARDGGEVCAGMAELRRRKNQTGRLNR